MTVTEPVPETRKIHRRVLKLMGNRFEFTVVEGDPVFAERCIDDAIEEVRRIERLLTTFSEDSQTAMINKNAGLEAVIVDEEVFSLIQRCQQISRITQGSFDISYGSIDKSLWNFDVTMKSLPTKEVAKRSIHLIDYRNIILDKESKTVFLKNAGMRIGFGGIGKGYAADRAKDLLVRKGIKSGVVNAAGDLCAWGFQPNGQAWTIGIADPDSSRHPFSSMQITGMAVATSGNYEKYAIIDGRKYSHTIDPRTGLPVTGIKSVTIISPHAELADAMATPVMIMGVDVGLDLVNQLDGVACLIIDDHNKLYTSRNIKLNQDA